MKHKLILLTTLTLCTFLIFSGCKKNNDNNNRKTIGYLYTTTNGEGINQVVRFSRFEDGSLADETAYTTNSKGGANVNAGGDAHGDFDAQGAVQIIGDYLLNVNAGGNTVSLFSLNRSSGDLAFKSNTPSGGTRPVSIAYTKKTGSSNEYWVVVGNQWNNPNVQKDGKEIERYPNNAFFTQDLKKPDASDMERNIQLFTFNSSLGTLKPEKLLDNYVRENGGPTTVSFSDDGTKLAVATWGIAHFNTQKTSLDEQHPSRVYVYNFSNGNVTGRRYFEEAGIAGTIGFSWAKGSNNRIYVSNFNLIPTKRDNSVTVLTDNSGTVIKSANYSVTSGTGITESCWTALNSTGEKLYVASFATNLISTFNSNSSGLTYSAFEARGGVAPAGDSKDIYITPDDRHLYNLGAFQSFSINGFTITGNSVNYKSQTFLSTTAAGAGTPGKYNFLGLMGYDIK
ncbi:MAG: hypothetical protein ABIN57_03380 [Chitinophagaceae bacterium]